MGKTNLLDSFLIDLLIYLIGRAPNTISELKIFRKHNNKLDVCGDLSFPLNVNGWTKYLTTNKRPNIIKYIENNTLIDSDFDDLINESKKWNSLQINRIKCSDSKVFVFLNRCETIKKVIKRILVENVEYGKSELSFSGVNIKIDVDNENLTDLTNLRIDLIRKVANNILKYCDCNTTEDCGEFETVYLTNQSKSKCYSKEIVCGVVITNKFGKKNTNISTDEFFKKRTVDMQLMAQHKYGVRNTSEPGWSDFFKRLGNAAVIIDLLHVKPSRPLIINENCATATCGKGAPFILYNCARLSEIFKKFDNNVSKGIYPSFPEIDEIDFSLLNHNEEWELIYVYLMQYPTIVKSCVSEILQSKLHTYNIILFLDALCSLFSVYYRRVRVLTEARSHLIPVLLSRVCLLKTIQQVLHNALNLLDIPPIKQM